jgi:hypothetical protein
MENFRRCCACNVEKPLDEFIANRTKKLGRSYTCKTCYSIRQKEYRAANRESVRLWRRAEYDRLKEAAFRTYGGYQCAWCGCQDESLLQIDHINNDGGHHRRSDPGAKYLYRWLRTHSYPSGFQVLCNRCNVHKHCLFAQYAAEAGTTEWHTAIKMFAARMGGAEAVISALQEMGSQ